MIRCSKKSGFTSDPMVPSTVIVVPFWVMSFVTVADEVVVSSCEPSGKVTLTMSPALMSGVTSKEVPAPQQTPPGWFTSKATSVPETTALAEPMTPVPGLVTSIVAVSPACSAYPSMETKSRSGKTTTLFGKTGTAAEAAGRYTSPVRARPVTAPIPVAARIT